MQECFIKINKIESEFNKVEIDAKIKFYREKALEIIDKTQKEMNNSYMRKELIKMR